MTPRLNLALATIIAFAAAPQIAVAFQCNGDACMSVAVGTWSNGKVTVTDKDKTGKIAARFCFRDAGTICNNVDLKPGPNSVELLPPREPPKNTTVEVTRAEYTQKPIPEYDLTHDPPTLAGPGRALWNGWPFCTSEHHPPRCRCGTMEDNGKDKYPQCVSDRKPSEPAPPPGPHITSEKEKQEFKAKFKAGCLTSNQKWQDNPDGSYQCTTPTGEVNLCYASTPNVPCIHKRF